jgi:hypothetical protein
MPLPVAQLAHRLRAADLDAPDLRGDDDLLQNGLLADLVVPDLHLHSPVERLSLRRGVARHGLTVPGPLEGDGLRGKREGVLEELRDLAGALPGEAGVVAVDFRQRLRQRLVVGVADQVQAHVVEVLHLLEDGSQSLHVAGGDVRDARREADRRHDVPELDGTDVLAEHLPALEPVARQRLEPLGILRPLHERSLARKLSLHRPAELHFAHVFGADDCGSQHPEDGEEVPGGHPAHRSPGMPAGRSGGEPRSQKTSGSIASG